MFLAYSMLKGWIGVSIYLIYGAAIVLAFMGRISLPVCLMICLGNWLFAWISTLLFRWVDGRLGLRLPWDDT